MPSQEMVYPPGCRAINEDIGQDELIRRLKTLAHTLQAMGQDNGNYQQYVPLAVHLVDDFFLKHTSSDVQLLIACCIADILRIYAPEAPYKDANQIKNIFYFVIKQLGGLKDPKDPAFKRYFYLLENLAYVKSFNMCFELEDCQQIIGKLFSLFFEIVNDEHSAKVKGFMLDIMIPLISESDTVSVELLDIILVNILEPVKTNRKEACTLAKDLVSKCADSLETYIQSFFNQVLLMGKEKSNLKIYSRVYDLIYELNSFCPSLLVAVLPQLECKLKVNSESERLSCVKLLASMFSEKNSTIAKNNIPLWKAFVGRYNDISPRIRMKCVQYSMHLMLNHPNLRTDIVEALKSRQHDTEETVRYEVVLAIVNACKKSLEIIEEHPTLLEYVKERTMDKKFKIRKEALTGLAAIYRLVHEDGNASTGIKKSISWIKTRILNAYYMAVTEDRCLVEKLLNTSLIPFQMKEDEKMLKLYQLVASLDDLAWKAFLEVHRHHILVRNSVSEWVQLHHKPADDENRDKEILAKATTISKYFPDPGKSLQYLNQFSANMLEPNSLILTAMDKATMPDITCKEYVEVTAQVMKTLGIPIMTNLYYNTIKMLFERMSSLLVDCNSLQVLISYLEEAADGGRILKQLELTKDKAVEKGYYLLRVLAYLFPHHFMHQDVMSKLLDKLEVTKNEAIITHTLAVFYFLGKYKPLGRNFASENDRLMTICQKYASGGTEKQAKYSVKCIAENGYPVKKNIFDDVFENIKSNLTADSERLKAAIVTLGHIAYCVPKEYAPQIKNLIYRRLAREILVEKGTEMTKASDEIREMDWCEEEQLPYTTACRKEALKAMARWLIGLKNEDFSAQKTFRMFSAFIDKEEILGIGYCSKAEISWLKLSAGCAFLRIAEQKGVGDKYTPEQFYTLSLLMIDESLQVRKLFVQKLHKRLNKGFPTRHIPLDFMGFYALVGLEENKHIKQTAREFMIIDINKRKEFVKNCMTTPSTSNKESVTSQYHTLLPDYTIVFAIAVLAHCPHFTDPTNVAQLTKMKACLWFVLEPLIVKNDSYCFGFYKELLDKIKGLLDAVQPEDEITNKKLWALSDLAMTILLAKTVNYEMNDFLVESAISGMYFKQPDTPLFQTDKVYLPPELIYKGEKTVFKKALNSSNAQNCKKTRHGDATTLNATGKDKEKADDEENGVKSEHDDEELTTTEAASEDVTPNKRARLTGSKDDESSATAAAAAVAEDAKEETAPKRTRLTRSSAKST